MQISPYGRKRPDDWKQEKVAQPVPPLAPGIGKGPGEFGESIMASARNTVKVAGFDDVDKECPACGTTSRTDPQNEICPKCNTPFPQGGPFDPLPREKPLEEREYQSASTSNRGIVGVGKAPDWASALVKVAEDKGPGSYASRNATVKVAGFGDTESITFRSVMDFPGEPEADVTVKAEFDKYVEATWDAPAEGGQTYILSVVRDSTGEEVELDHDIPREREILEGFESEAQTASDRQEEGARGAAIDAKLLELKEEGVGRGPGRRIEREEGGY